MFTEEIIMQRCLELALKGRSVAPNPMVGAVLVHGGRIIGEGWHRQYGADHAEVDCLKNVAENDRPLIPGSTMFVSLEPCAHHGKTPPCAARLVSEGIAAVIVCNDDPFEQVRGKGYAMLQQHGVRVRRGILADKGRWLNRRFFSFHERQRPYIILKWAETQRGYFAPLNRTRFQMSNPHSRQLVHRWRTEEQAIAVGFNTAVADDPQLDARYWQGRQPLRLVFDRNLQLPDTLRLMDGKHKTWVINEQKEHDEDKLRFVKLRFSPELLPALMQLLYQENIQSIIIEGGAGLLQSFIDADLWDEARIFKTPDLLEHGVPAPVPKPARQILSVPISGDRLEVYTHTANPYHFVPGMPL